LGSDFELIILMSSTKRMGLARPTIVFERSFIYNIKSKGPRMEPWGMPYPVGSHFE
jgi:hypothetical protein